MEHPDISMRNANLRYCEMLEAAAQHRRAKIILLCQPKKGFLLALRRRLPGLPGRRLEKAADSAA
jgi:hypothetical protein